jgi:hypothetical protein
VAPESVVELLMLPARVGLLAADAAAVPVGPLVLSMPAATAARHARMRGVRRRHTCMTATKSRSFP